MKKAVCCLLILAVVFLSGCFGIMTQEDMSEPSPGLSIGEVAPLSSAHEIVIEKTLNDAFGQSRARGEVQLKSGGKTYLPATIILYEQVGDWALDGYRGWPQEVVDTLAAIDYSEDFVFEFIGPQRGSVGYTLYLVTEQGENIEVYRKQRFEAPAQAGEYTLCIDASWSLGEDHSGMQYFFKISVGEVTMRPHKSIWLVNAGESHNSAAVVPYSRFINYKTADASDITISDYAWAPIPYSEDITFSFMGELYEEASYTLFKDPFEVVYEEARTVLPITQGAGVYLLAIKVHWKGEEEAQVHLFKIVF